MINVDMTILAIAIDPRTLASEEVNSVMALPDGLSDELTCEEQERLHELYTETSNILIEGIRRKMIKGIEADNNNKVVALNS